MTTGEVKEAQQLSQKSPNYPQPNNDTYYVKYAINNIFSILFLYVCSII